MTSFKRFESKPVVKIIYKPAFHFVLGYQTVNFRILVVPLNKALFFFCKFWILIYSAVFTPHIYFIIFSLAWSPVISLRLDFLRYRAENVFGKQFKHKNGQSHWPVFFKINGMARDTDNNKLHMKKTPRLTKGQRYCRLKQKRTFQTLWKENNSMPLTLKKNWSMTLTIFMFELLH
jgi:hypothetical protein